MVLPAVLLAAPLAGKKTMCTERITVGCTSTWIIRAGMGQQCFLTVCGGTCDVNVQLRELLCESMASLKLPYAVCT